MSEVLLGLVPGNTIVYLLVLAGATALIWKGSGWLETSAEDLSAHYGLPAVVQGSIVVAVGSSFPELASVVFAALAGVFDMGIGAVVGSAVFNVLVIPGLAGVLTEDPLDSSRTIVYKEAQFYMLAVSGLIVTFSMAVIYYPVGAAGSLQGEMTRGLALIPLLLYGLYIFIQWQDVSDHDAGEPPEGIEVGKQWALLAGGLLLILVAVEQLVAAVSGLALTFGIPEFLAGVVIIAGATSLPDTLVSVRSARAGKHVTSLANVLGSNTFDLLVAIPLGVLIVGVVPINFAVAVPMMGVLTVATILLFAVLRTDMGMSNAEAYGLLLAYVVFVAWILAESVGLTSLIKGG